MARSDTDTDAPQGPTADTDAEAETTEAVPVPEPAKVGDPMPPAEAAARLVPNDRARLRYDTRMTDPGETVDYCGHVTDIDRDAGTVTIRTGREYDLDRPRAYKALADGTVRELQTDATRSLQRDAESREAGTTLTLTERAHVVPGVVPPQPHDGTPVTIAYAGRRGGDHTLSGEAHGPSPTHRPRPADALQLQVTDPDGETWLCRVTNGGNVVRLDPFTSGSDITLGTVDTVTVGDET
jgi:hypothetical protein